MVTDRKHAPVMSTKVGTELLIARTIPTKYCKLLAHPMTPAHQAKMNQSVLRVFELFIPIESFAGSARGFVNQQGHHDTMVMNIKVARLFGYMANKVTSIKSKKSKDPETGEDTSEDIVSTSSVIATWEMVYHKDDPTRIVGYRLRLTEQGQPGPGMSGELAELIKKNEKANGTQLYSGRARAAACVTSHTQITESDWRSICLFYNPRLLDELDDDGPGGVNGFNVTNPNSRWSPENVFSIQRSLQMARNMGAHEDFCDENIYYGLGHNGGRYMQFARGGAHVFQIHETDLDPRDLNERFLPHIRPDPRAHTLAITNFAHLHNMPLLQARKSFEATACATSNAETANDISALGEHIKSDDKDLRAKYRCELREGDDPEADGVTSEYHVQRRQRQIKDWLPAFFEIVSPQGDCPPALQTISLAFSNYLAINKHIVSIPREQSTDRTRFQDQMIEWAVVMESIVTVDSAHQDCILYLLSALHVYSRVDMNVHHLLLGPPGIGKSFALTLITKLFLQGTFMSLTYFSDKAFSAPGKANGQQIIILEDAPSTAFGVQGGSGGGKGSSDKENSLKQMLTSMEMTAQVLNMEPKRAGEFIRSETGCVLFAAMNDPSSKFPTAILDRFVVSISAGAEAPATGDDSTITMMGKGERSQSDAVKMAMGDIKLIWTRRQILFAIILYMESCGVLKTIDTTAAEAIYAQVAARARTKAVDMQTRERNVRRFRMIVRTLVVLSAIDLVWDSPDSPAFNTPHSNLHFLLVEKYLVSSVQHGVFALGLVARQWQDPTRSCIVAAMKKHWFPKADKHIAEFSVAVPYKDAYPNGKVVSNDAPIAKAFFPSRSADGSAAQPVGWDGMAEERKFWMYDRCNIGGSLIPAMAGCNGRTPGTQELAQHITAKLMPHLSKKYLAAEVTAKIMEMTVDTVTVTRTLFHEDDDCPEMETETRPQLILEPDHIRLAVPTMAHAQEGDVVYRCVEDAVSLNYHLTKNPDHKTFLYGETETTPGCRHIWRIVRASEDLAGRGIADPSQSCRVYSANYADSATKRITQNALRHVNPGYADKRNMQQLFSSRMPFVVQDMDIDKRSALMRADALGLSFEDQHAAPSNDRSVHDARYREIYKERKIKLLKYPECFSRRDKAGFKRKWEDKFAEDPTPFLTSTKYESMLKRQKARPSLYAAVPIESQTMPALQRQQDCGAGEAEAVLSQRELDYQRMTDE